MKKAVHDEAVKIREKTVSLSAIKDLEDQIHELWKRNSLKLLIRIPNIHITECACREDLQVGYEVVLENGQILHTLWG